VRWAPVAVALGCLSIAATVRAEGPHLSLGANAGIASTAGIGVTRESVQIAPQQYVVLDHNRLATSAAVALNLAVRVGTRRWRAGLLADLVLCPPQAGHALLVDLRPMLSLDANLRLENDVRLWLGLAAGPSFRNLDQIVNGISTLVSLDVAVPISSHFAIDVVVRGGFDEALSVATPHPDPLGELALGVTWD
jgi:hypothetical protein